MGTSLAIWGHGLPLAGGINLKIGAVPLVGVTHSANSSGISKPDIYGVEMDGDPKLLDTIVTGDWVYRDGAGG